MPLLQIMACEAAHQLYAYPWSVTPSRATNSAEEGMRRTFDRERRFYVESIGDPQKQSATSSQNAGLPNQDRS